MKWESGVPSIRVWFSDRYYSKICTNTRSDRRIVNDLFFSHNCAAVSYLLFFVVFPALECRFVFFCLIFHATRTPHLFFCFFHATATRCGSQVHQAFVIDFWENVTIAPMKWESNTPSIRDWFSDRFLRECGNYIYSGEKGVKYTKHSWLIFR